MIKIKDAFVFLKKSKIKAGDGLEVGKYPFYTSSSVLSKYLDSYEIEEESLIFGTGGSASVYHSYGKFSSSTDCFVAQSNNKYELDLRYVYLFLSGNIHILENGFKGAGLKHISKKYLEDVEIPLPSLETQKKIVEVLDKAQGIIYARKEQIRLMDELIQSVFYEMFGDPVKNSYDYPLMPFDKFSNSRLGKMLDKKQITGDHLKKYLGNSNVRWFEFDFSDLKEMDFNERDRETFQLRKGDLIICEGGEIGRCAIWQEEVENCFYQKALHRVRLNSKIVLPEYIQYVLWFYSQRGGFKDYGTSATISHLTGAKLKKMKVPIPPMEEQLKFKNFLIKKKFELDEIKKAYELYQELYASLMNDYLNINGIGGN